MEPRQDTKCCPMCAETINAAAKVCPFCCMPQAGFARWKHVLGPVLSALILAAAIVFVCNLLFPDGLNFEGRSFTSHRQELIVVRTSLKQEDRGPNFWLSGYISNTGPYSWRVDQLEVRFLENRTNLVDVRFSKLPEPFVVQPRQEQAFRTRLGSLVFTNRSVVEVVRVQNATDGTHPSRTD